MSELLPVIIIGFAVLAAILVVLAKKNRQAPVAGYELHERLLSAAEGSLYGVLIQALSGQRLVFAKVRMADVLKAPKTVDRSAWQKAFNRIKAKHFDFVLCEPGTTRIVAVLELNDKSHGRKRRQQRDAFVRSACDAAGLRLIEVPAKKSYVAQEIRELVLQDVVSSGAVPGRTGA